MEIPEVPWRYGEKYLVTDFIQHQNVAVREIALSLPSGNQDKFVLAASVHIRDAYFYPLDNAGNPSTSGQLLRYKKGLMSYHFKKCEDYVWALPCEVINTGCGYCAETANLATSLLIAGGISNCWVVLGEVKTAKDDQLLGYHAWTECPYLGAQNVMETTVDVKDVNILYPISSTYDRLSQWAQKNNLYYVPQARYNTSEYIGEGPLGGMMVLLMGHPAKPVEVKFTIFGNITKRRHNISHAVLLKEARLVRSLLLEACRRGS